MVWIGAGYSGHQLRFKGQIRIRGKRVPVEVLTGHPDDIRIVLITVPEESPEIEILSPAVIFQSGGEIHAPRYRIDQCNQPVVADLGYQGIHFRPVGTVRSR